MCQIKFKSKKEKKEFKSSRKTPDNSPTHLSEPITENQHFLLMEQGTKVNQCRKNLLM